MLLTIAGDDDVVVAPITSRLRPSPYHVEISRWDGAGLLRPSLVRLHKATTIERARVEQRLGILHPSDRQRLGSTLNNLCATIQAMLALS